MTMQANRWVGLDKKGRNVLTEYILQVTESVRSCRLVSQEIPRLLYKPKFICPVYNSPSLVCVRSKTRAIIISRDNFIPFYVLRDSFVLSSPETHMSAEQKVIRGAFGDEPPGSRGNSIRLWT